MKRYIKASEESEEYIVYVDGEEFESYDFEIEAINRASDLCDFDIDDNGELLKDVYVERILYLNDHVDDVETIWSSEYDYVY